jgi:hypothetical protein
MYVKKPVYREEYINGVTDLEKAKKSSKYF